MDTKRVLPLEDPGLELDISQAVSAKAAADTELRALLETKRANLAEQLEVVNRQLRGLGFSGRRPTVDIIREHIEAARAAGENGTALRKSVLRRLKEAGHGPFTGWAKSYKKALELVP